jgi:anti-anti-sigma factor
VTPEQHERQRLWVAASLQAEAQRAHRHDTYPRRAPRLFSCRVVYGAGRVTLSLGGELDVMAAAEARSALLSLEPARGGTLVIDLRDLSFMDSTGVRLILQAMDTADRHGAGLVLIKGPEAVQRALEVVGLAEQLTFVEVPGPTHQEP